MGQVKAGNVVKGMFILDNKKIPYLIVEREFVNPGKGQAFTRLKMKNLRNGSIQRITPKSHDMMETIEVHEVESQYLYADGDSFHFMDQSTYEQFPVSREALGEDKPFFLKEGEPYKLLFFEDEFLDLLLPPKIDLVVTEAQEGVKGDSVSSGGSKVVTVETGLNVKVPLFIKQGETIRISVETKEYQERVSS